MSEIQPYQPGSIASPLVGEAPRNPKGEALRAYAQNIGQVTNAISQLRGAQINGLANVLQQGLWSGGYAAGHIIGRDLAAKRQLAKTTQQLHNTQSHQQANADAGSSLAKYEDVWNQTLQSVKNDPYFQKNPDAGFKKVQQIVTENQIYNPDGTITDNPYAQSTLRASIQSNKQDRNNPNGDPYPGITFGRFDPQITKAASSVISQATNWASHQKNQNALASIPLAIDNAASDTAATTGGLSAAIQQGALKMKSVSTQIDNMADSLGNKAPEFRAQLFGKVNAAAFISAATNHSDNPIVALAQHQEALQSLNTGILPGSNKPIDFRIGPQARESISNMLQASITHDTQNIERKARIDAETGIATIQSQILDANNNPGSPVKQQAVLNFLNDKAKVLQGRISITEKDPTLPDAAKATIMAADNAQLKEIQSGLNSVQANQRRSAGEAKQAQVEQEKAAKESLKSNQKEAEQTYSNKMLHFIQTVNTNVGKNTDDVQKEAVELLHYGRTMVKAKYLTPDQTKELEILKIAGETTKWQMRPAQDINLLLAHFEIGSPTLKQQKATDYEKASAAMKASIAQSVEALQTGADNAKYADSTFATGVQKSAFYEKMQILDSNLAKSNAPLNAVAYQKRRNEIAQWALKTYPGKAPLQGAVSKQAPKPTVTAAPQGHVSKDGLVPPPPPAGAMGMLAPGDPNAFFTDMIAKATKPLVDEIKKLRSEVTTNKTTPEAKPEQATESAVKMGSAEYPSTASYPGVIKGNIDLSNRPVIEFHHGLNDENSTPAARKEFPNYADDPQTYGSEYSMSFEDGSKIVSIPTIFDGKLHSRAEAEQHYHQTGEFLAMANKDNADMLAKYEDAIHNRKILVSGKPYPEGLQAIAGDLRNE